MAGKPQFRAEGAEKQTAENGGSREVGTLLANYRDTPSCHVAASERCQPNTWGGARNRSDRTSNELSDKQVAGLIEAAASAFVSGRIFQRHWTVHYGLAGIQPNHGALFVSRLLDLVAKQARRQGGRMTALWVRECASSKGEHVHILLHLPAGTTLRNRTRRWIEAAGGTWRRGVSKVRIVGGRLTKIGQNGDSRILAHATNVTRYLLKAASKETAASLRLTGGGTGGRIVGKRCGWTNNIGRASRGRWGDLRQ